MKSIENVVEYILFNTRWIQMVVYLVLILAELVFVMYFLREGWHFIHSVILEGGAVTESQVVTMIVGLIDLSMVAQLIRVVAVGGYVTFVSKIHLESHPDAPDWLAHANADMLKYKLATSLVGISSVHLLKSFMSIDTRQPTHVILQIAIHVVFLISALALWHISRKSKHRAEHH